METERPQATDQQCTHLLRTLLADRAEMLATLAPEGWQRCPLRRIFHPTAEQKYEEAVRMRENLKHLKELSKKRDKTDRGTQEETPPPRPEDFTEDPPDAGHPDDELTTLLGNCLWLIFSDNHTVFDAEGREYNLGSFRGSGGFIADFLNEHFPLSEGSFDYMDFYCAGAFTFGRADTRPVFQLLFERLKAQGCDWEYSFPRIGIVDFGALREEAQPDDPTLYDPAKAMEQEMERAARQRETDRLRAQLDEAYEKELEEAKYKAPPPAVEAYRRVYGRLPDGFPQV